MKIALEARSLSTLGGGVRTYTKEVIKGILASQFPAEFSVYYDSPKHLKTFSGAKEKVVPVFHPLARMFWDYFLLPAALKKDNIDYIHYFKPATTPFKKPIAIATIYDVIPLLYPDTQTAIQLAYWKKQLPLVAKTCKHIITISECSKKDIVKHLGITPEKISVTYLGVNGSLKPASEETKESIKKQYCLPSEYILYLGTIEPRKNVARLIRAFDKAAESFPHALVLAGKWGWRFEDVKESIENAKNKDRIITLSHVAFENLPALISAADAFVFPSIYEGFGLPPLEAMSCGVPVVTSNISSLPEVVGEHAITIDPYSEVELVNAIKKIICDRELNSRLRREGLEWASKFTWEQTVKETLDIYSKIFI